MELIISELNKINTKIEKVIDVFDKVASDVNAAKLSADKSALLLDTIKNEITNSKTAEATPALPPLTPPKTTARYINDTLFAASVGAMLTSANLFGNNPSNSNKLPSTDIILFGVFFILFRIKAYLDDNSGLIEEETDIKKSGTANNIGSVRIAGFAISFICWLLYASSGFFLFNKVGLSYALLTLFFLLFTVWMVVKGFWQKHWDRDHLKMLTFNVVYVISLCGITGFIKMGGPYEKVPLMFLLLITVVLDFLLLKSLKNIFK
jgi:hypothetical protein